MRTSIYTLPFVVIASLSAAGSPPILANDGWIEGFHEPGTGGYVYALGEYEGDLVLGGPFQRAGDVFGNGIARWDGEEWSPFGDGISNGAVWAVTEYDGQLIIGGNFQFAGGVLAKGIAAWDGDSWNALGSGIDGFAVYALLEWDGKLIAGGWFTGVNGTPAEYLAAWDGSSWTELGGGTSGIVHALGIYQDDLVVGGAFLTAGGQNIRELARWNGSSWSSFGSGSFNDDVRCITEHNGSLYVGGAFTQAGGVAANRIARWNGSSWSALGSGCDDIVEGIDGNGARLYVGGRFHTAGGLAADHQAYWNGSGWSTLSFFGASSWVRDVHRIDGTVYFGGDFVDAGGQRVNHLITHMNDAVGAGLGVSIRVDALAVQDGALFAAGDFSAAGTEFVGNIARLDEDGWTNVSGANGPVRALTVFDDTVIAGGEFTSFGGAPGHTRISQNVTGAFWQPMGDGFDDAVGTLVVAGGDLYAAGRFYFSGATFTPKVARWNGASWEGTGGVTHTNPLVEPAVNALTEYQGNLVAAGFFDGAGGVPANGIALYDGSVWSPLGTGLAGGTPTCLTVWNGNLVAGGSFTQAGGSAAPHLASWNGSSWSAIPGIPDVVSALGTYQGDLVVCGSFETAGGIPAQGVARWDGIHWQAFEEGIDGIVRALAVDGNSLYFGGFFDAAGPNAVGSLAAWVDPAVSSLPTPEGPGSPLDPRSASFRVWPNPLESAGTLWLDLPTATEVRVTLHDATGRELGTVWRERLGSGAHRREIDISSAHRPRSAGVYFFRLDDGHTTSAKKLIIR